MTWEQNIVLFRIILQSKAMEDNKRMNSVFEHPLNTLFKENKRIKNKRQQTYMYISTKYDGTEMMYKNTTSVFVTVVCGFSNQCDHDDHTHGTCCFYS